MIEFKPVRLEDKQIIERHTMPSGILNCDLAFANMYCWQAMYHSAWAVIDGFLVIRFHIGGGEKIGYMQPVGEGDFAGIIPALRADAHAHGQRLRIIGLTDEGREMIRNMHAGLFAFESDRALEDYVYNAEDLRNLTGRRYQPKRNHINRFMSEYPDFRYEELTRDRFAECMQLEREWRRAHEGHTSELCAEQRAMQRAFDHFEELEMLGGCIYVGDKLVAFTFGSAVNDHTFDTHVEKADTDYDGAFTIINKLFAEHLPERFTLINREEDLGIDGLRQSKLSYHPAVIQHKFTAIHLHPDEIACKELWTAAFGDDEQFIDSFLIRYYSRSRMLTAEYEGGDAPPAAVRKPAGPHDLYLRRGDGSRIPPPGAGRQADGRSNAADRRSRRRRGAADPQRGMAARILRPIRILRRNSRNLRFAGRLRLRHGRSVEGPCDGLAPRCLCPDARNAAMQLL